GRFDCRLQPVRRFPFSRRDRDRPERGVVAGAKLARDPADRLRVQYRSAFNGESGRELALISVKLELHDRHGGDRPDKMRINYTQQRFRNLWEFVVDLEMDSRSQESEGFE